MYGFRTVSSIPCKNKTNDVGGYGRLFINPQDLNYGTNVIILV